MPKIIKMAIVILLTALFVAPAVVSAQADDTVFKAQVVDVIREVKKTNDKGREIIQQVLKLKGLENGWKDKEILYDGTALDAEMAGQNIYKKNDKVLVMRSVNDQNEESFFITDYVRTGKLYFIILLFFAAIIVIARKQGLKAIVGLAATFIVLMKFIVPKILAGSNPVFISIIGSLIILVITLYLVHGFNSKSSVAILGTILSLLITGVLSVIFTNLTRLTGFADEESMYLLNIGQQALNIKGILLAGMIIGALGVLDDITVSQASIAEQIYKANPELTSWEIYKRAMKVGVDHVSSIVNTLVLAYAGASLPLMILFAVDSAGALTLGQAINNEAIATEIVRTVAGSIGLVFAVPITTLIAANFFKRKIIKPEAAAHNHAH
ncbi:MAG: YibE/F family protein [Patescibacteria group bacterium]